MLPVEWPRERALRSVPGEKVPVLLPFETFQKRRNVQPDDKARDRVLVVWLPDTLFDLQPMEHLAMLVAEAAGSR